MDLPQLRAPQRTLDPIMRQLRHPPPRQVTMCGNNRCIYYGCDACSLRLTGDIIHAHRDECDCTNEINAEFCSPACLTDYQTWDPCDCGHDNPWQTRNGPSTK